MVAFVTLGIASTSALSSIQAAAAAPSNANLWAVPVNSRIDDGNYQILRLIFNTDSGNPLDKIRITLDKGTPNEKVLEFDGNGNIITGDPAFVSVSGSIRFVTTGDGYYSLAKLKGKFKILIDKTELTIGDHDALAEIFRTGGADVLTDDAHFKLRAGSSGEADLTPTFLGAPDNIKPDKKYNAFVKEKNQGTGNAGDHSIKVYLSDDNVLDGSDTLVGDKDVQNLKAGKTRMVTVQFELPEGADLGDAYLIVKVDGDDDVSESNEGNNTQPEHIEVVSSAHSLSEHGQLKVHTQDDDGKENNGKKKDK
jgi:hypothetical protein